MGKADWASNISVGVEPVVQVLITENELALRQVSMYRRQSRTDTYSDLLPAGRIPQEVDTPFADAAFHVNWAWIRFIASQPAPLEFVVPPFAAHQLLRHELLHDIPRHAVEDVEERLVAETRDARLKGLDVGDIVARWQREVLFHRHSGYGCDKRRRERRM